jgi:hypothetical protein
MSLSNGRVTDSTDAVDELVSRISELHALGSVLAELASAIPTEGPERQRLHRLIFLAERQQESVLSFAEGVAAGMRAPAQQPIQISAVPVG